MQCEAHAAVLRGLRRQSTLTVSRGSRWAVHESPDCTSNCHSARSAATPPRAHSMLALSCLRPLAAAAGQRRVAKQTPGRPILSDVGPRRTQRPRAVLAVRAIAVDPPGVMSPGSSELAEETRLASGAGDIYGIPRRDWLVLQSPARYLGNEWGAMHKAWSSASVRFTLAYPEVTSSAPQLCCTTRTNLRAPHVSLEQLACFGLYCSTCAHLSYRRVLSPASESKTATASFQHLNYLVCVFLE